MSSCEINTYFTDSKEEVDLLRKGVMCRKNAEGGRRCGAHSDPTRKDAYNKHRRDLYVAQKHGLLFMETRNSDESFKLSDMDADWETWAENLSDDDTEDIFHYTNQEYDAMNSYLYDPKNEVGIRNGDEESEKKIARQIARLDTILSTAPSGKTRTVLRSFRPPVDHPSEAAQWIEKNYRVGEEVNFAAYTSTSLNAAAVMAMLVTPERRVTGLPWSPNDEEWTEKMHDDKSQENTVFEIITDKGAPVHRISHMPQEAEILLPRNTSYTVLRVLKDVPFETNKHLLYGDPTPQQIKTATVVQLIDNDVLHAKEINKNNAIKKKLPRIFSTMKEQEMCPEAENVILSHVKKYGNPQWGNDRVVFDTGDGYVTKIAYTWDGYTANGREVNQSQDEDAMIPVASCKFSEDRDNDPNAQVSMIRMEKVDVIENLSYDELPTWAGYVDGAQVGRNKEGKIVAFDL